MIRQALSPAEAVRILNELVVCDAQALQTLVEHRVTCNVALADHPEAQVGKTDGQWHIGLLGVLNALFGTLGSEAGTKEGWGALAGVYDDEGRLVNFVLTQDPSVPISPRNQR
jgi:hypothetical protein